MPKVFSDADRNEIRNALLAAGKEHFQKHGLRRTRVEELCRAAGIAKGTFYNFFESKAHLCFAIFDRQELEMADDIAAIFNSSGDPEEVMRGLVAYSVDFVAGDSLLARLQETGEVSLLARGVGRERLEAHLSHDNGTAAALIESLRRTGVRCELPPEVLAGILRALVMITLHKSEIGETVFPTVIDAIGRWVAAGIARAI